MKVLIDQGLPRSVAALLREAGKDAIHTGQCGLATASDSSIIRFAHEKDFVVVT
jgi:predicted nuclease of predicted toxin-antitoxin system